MAHQCDCHHGAVFQIQIGVCGDDVLNRPLKRLHITSLRFHFPPHYLRHFPCLFRIHPRQQPAHLVGGVQIVGAGDEQTLEVHLVARLGKGGGDSGEIPIAVGENCLCCPQRLIAETCPRLRCRNRSPRLRPLRFSHNSLYGLKGGGKLPRLRLGLGNLPQRLCSVPFPLNPLGGLKGGGKLPRLRLGLSNRLQRPRSLPFHLNPLGGLKGGGEAIAGSEVCTQGAMTATISEPLL